MFADRLPEIIIGDLVNNKEEYFQKHHVDLYSEPGSLSG